MTSPPRWLPTNKIVGDPIEEIAAMTDELPPDDSPAAAKLGRDFNDMLNEDGPEAVAGVVDAGAGAPRPENGQQGKGRKARKRRTPQRDILISLTEGCEFWHDASRAAYVTYSVRGHREHWPVRAREFRLWLSGEYFRRTDLAVGSSALDDGLRVLEARAINDGPLHTPFVRVGRAAGRLYLDLADDEWGAVEIDGNGWRVVEAAPARFLRTPAMRALPTPDPGGMIEDLRQFANVRSDGDYMLVVAWLVAALRESGPFPILAVNGEQDSGKSIFCRLLRSLVDPSLAPIRTLPKDERDLLVSAANSWVLAFDNLSGLPSAMSDSLCRLATGGGMATRANYTDREEAIFEASRPIILNGIPLLTDRADLASRALTIQLCTIKNAARRAEDELLSAFEAARPRILGALLDAVSAAERNLAGVKLDQLPRLADFAKWITAAEPGLGWQPGEFLAAFAANRREVSESAFEADMVAVAIRNCIGASEFPEGWRGAATELLSFLTSRVGDAVRRQRRWPMSPSVMGSAVMRAAPLLRQKGFVVERQHSGTTTIVIVPPSAFAAAAAADAASVSEEVPL